ncbi:hypothetical protein SAMN03080598_04014 [Algoriphagus boritolerans DSM 17298 = JCM 18970]|uniref:Uncharacterized protein n=1 Tax=Algoriphagus boritolerans DSM 17298 = JCM 18970 TaxID=1120964 RepID=A0A1H6ACX0_9BACT|nr:hypothetical protein SAMN03080598_04014 [Algoriphagus boritolerans DSM 17298 = JCM 18970]
MDCSSKLRSAEIIDSLKITLFHFLYHFFYILFKNIKIRHFDLTKTQLTLILWFSLALDTIGT